MKKIYFVSSLLVAASFTACDDDKFTPGPQDPEGCAGIYFPASNRQSIELTGAEDTYDLTIARIHADKAVTVPLQITTNIPDGLFSAPAEVSFADGETEAVITLDLENVPANKQFEINVNVPENMSTMYGEGSRGFDGTLYKGQWEVLCDVTYQSYYYDYDDYTGTMSTLAGLGRYRLDNFMQSGLPLEFETGVFDPSSTDYNKLMPFYATDNTNAEFVGPDWGDEYARTFLIWDKKTDTYPEWTMEGMNDPIAWWYVYVCDDGSQSCIWNKSMLWLVNWYFTIYDDPEGDGNWDYTSVYLGKFKFDPFN